MSVGLIIRPWSKVEHLGVWAHDRTSEAESYATGGFVPICSSERNTRVRWRLVHHLTMREVGDRRLVRKPLCSRCRRLLTDLTDLSTEE